MAQSPAHLRERGIPYWKQIIASGLYTGLAPIASGTVASAVACLFFFIPGFDNLWVLLAASLTAFFVGIKLGDDIEHVLGPDPSFVTLDEFAGQWLALASPAALFGSIAPSGVYWVILSFFVFRAFDIAKIWPASALERRPGGIGVMGDDMVAGLYANIVSHLIWFGLAWLGPITGFLQ
jgi:phosphatidylglycerophosphatase A